MPQLPCFPALPRRYFPVHDLGTTAARARDTVGEAAREAASPDAALLAACRELIKVDERRGRLIESGRGRSADEQRLSLLDERYASLLQIVIDLRPATLQGHRARAAVFLAADDNALVMSANRWDHHAARMLAALIFDLLDKP